MNNNLVTLEEIKLDFMDRKVIFTKGHKNRIYRKAISELRKNDIIFIPIADFTYKRIEYCTQKERTAFIRSQLSSMQTQYFNSLRPIQKYMTDEQLRLLHEGGLFKDYKEEI